LHQCNSALSSGCASIIKNTKRATCECIEETRTELKKKIANIADSIKSVVDGNARGTPAIGSGSKVDSCVASIKSQLVTSVNDWVTVIDSALNSCIKNKPSGQNLGMDSLLNVGCRKVVDGNARGTPAIGSGSKVDSCVASIKSQLVTPVNDWVTVIDSALNSCIKNKPSGQNLGMDSLLNVGCRKVIADTTGTATSQLKSGFDFANNLIDAMVDRSGRFCGGPHCPE
uniref:C6 transcription factor n=1 Tax=Ascaris lumbricoides TaxID=6252 RepID=A0A0M3HFD9_ASCLU